MYLDTDDSPVKTDENLSFETISTKIITTPEFEEPEGLFMLLACFKTRTLLLIFK